MDDKRSEKAQQSWRFLDSFGASKAPSDIQTVERFAQLLNDRCNGAELAVLMHEGERLTLDQAIAETLKVERVTA